MRPEPPPDGASQLLTVWIVQTVAHLKIAGMKTCATGCQRCHRLSDAPVRAACIKARAREPRADGDLFACTEVS